MRQIFCAYSKWAGRDAVDQEREDGLAIGQIFEILRTEYRCELFFEEFRVGRTDTESRFGADVADDRIADRLFELRDELVCDRERQFIFTRLREDRGDRRR